ncbi:MAG: ribosome maturation factor RimM [Gammaproteobacteria bacterium]|nr:ribosome maturation factor RimM [Gammaproteobacteria bacterium]
MAQDNPEGYVIVGQISGLHGVKGWVKVYSYTDPRENIIQYSQWFLRSAEGWQEIKLEEGRRQGKGVVAKLEGYIDRDMSAQLIDRDIALLKDQLPQLEKNEYYWNDLIGCKVINQDKTEFGIVERMIETGSNDVLIVKGDRERLIPYIRGQVIKNIDLDSSIIQVDWDPDF